MRQLSLTVAGTRVPPDHWSLRTENFDDCQSHKIQLPYNGRAVILASGGIMISRRRFLEFGGVAAGVAALPHPLMPSGAITDEKSGDSSLPPSLARLKSRK